MLELRWCEASEWQMWLCDAFDRDAFDDCVNRFILPKGGKKKLQTGRHIDHS